MRIKRCYQWTRLSHRFKRQRELYGPKFVGDVEPGAWPVPAWGHVVVIVLVSLAVLFGSGQ